MNKKFYTSFVFAAFSLCLLITSHNVLSKPAPTIETLADLIQPPTFNLVGQAKMKWLWFNIYEAKLSTPSGSYQVPTEPLTLELIYARKISRDDLIKATLKEWSRQEITYLPQWISELSEIWPNISPDDRLLLHVDQNNQSHFFYNDAFVGTIEDANFAKSFYSIWLSDNTLKPKLRNQLIGLKL